MISMFFIVISIILIIRHPEADPRAGDLGLPDPRSHQRQNPPPLPSGELLMMPTQDLMDGGKMGGDVACCCEENEMEDWKMKLIILN